MRKLVVYLALAAALAGCGRAYYRRSADRETYPIIEERKTDPRWAVPPFTIEPPPQSRLADPYDQDRPPIPPDDPAAHRYMHCANGLPGYRRWHKDGDAPFIEDPRWRDGLPLESDGVLALTQERSVELGVLHSREYQTELENVYLEALALTLNRFEFDLHWFGRTRLEYTHFGASSLPTESNTLTQETNLGFERALATGGQFAADLANTWVWEYTGPDNYTVSSNLGFSLIQPLLRGAGREVRMEALTQAERNVLYAVRDFARFRKEFAVTVTTRGGFLSLLLQVQNIRNLRNNLRSLEDNLRLHEALFESGQVSAIQVDQAFQSLQQGQLQLLQAQTNLENALDAFKTTLGLPPNVPIRLDDALLQPFELNDPALTKLQEDLKQLKASYRQLGQAPALEELRAGFARLRQMHARGSELLGQVRDEIARWGRQLPEPQPDEDQRQKRERGAHQALSQAAERLADDFAEALREIAKAEGDLAEARRQEGWDALQKRIRQVDDLAAQLFVIQTQERVYAIKLPPIGYKEDLATEVALANRLDLMNQRARVVDAWRQITVTADRLEADLDVFVNGNLGVDADATRPFDFSARNSTYRVGFRFDGPLNRKIERNAYRASLVAYQRSRRDYMAAEDGIRQAVRRDLRQLETERLNFEIARASLVTAARQVEQTRERILTEARPDNTNYTQDVLNALNALLQAQNTLIASWVNYEAGRAQLLLDLDVLQLDERGVPIDERNRGTDQSDPGAPPGAGCPPE